MTTRCQVQFSKFLEAELVGKSMDASEKAKETFFTEPIKLAIKWLAEHLYFLTAPLFLTALYWVKDRVSPAILLSISGVLVLLFTSALVYIFILRQKVKDLEVLLFNKESLLAAITQERQKQDIRIADLSLQVANYEKSLPLRKADENWKQVENSYSLHLLCEGVIVYASKSPNPTPHYLCANCFTKKQEGILQRTDQDYGGTYYVCSNCSSKLFDHSKPKLSGNTEYPTKLDSRSLWPPRNSWDEIE